jgi:nucleoside-diphosphate-sugar epimerase
MIDDTEPAAGPDPDLAGRPVLVTGAGGFIGRRLVAALSAAGARVTALLRGRHGARRLEALGARVVVCDLRRPERLAEVLSGQEVVFHLAYDIRAGATANLAAFEGLLAAAQGAPVGRIVHASSVVVYDGWPHGRLDEESPVTPPGGVGADYRSAKIEMERRLLAGDIAAAILQPTIVYGPGSALWTEAPLAALGRGGVVLPDPPGLCPAVFVDDVVQAALRAAALPDLGRERFLVSGADSPDSLDWRRVFEGYRAILGRGEVILEPAAALEARLGPPPPAGARGAVPASARASAALRRLVGHGTVAALAGRLRALAAPVGPARPDRFMLELYRARPCIDISRAKRRLGYAPRFDFAAGLREIEKSLQSGRR